MLTGVFTDCPMCYLLYLFTLCILGGYNHAESVVGNNWLMRCSR